ncbi:MAG: DUF4912 domain-containing protein [Candidatus Omnitrophica bacterium]|nr:DUF4912 domain-containing protein [Candidatus Omnitrophota bacterium]MDD5592398.1 DUF4912 domain-containing protein [Candidatus Omnitrophota bacterium]
MAKLRKVNKAKKKLIKNRKPVRAKRPTIRLRLKKIPAQGKKEIIGQQETAIEQTKFSAAQQAPEAKRAVPQDLPSGYGQDRMVLQVRDPRWIHAYWEAGIETFKRLKAELKDNFYKARRVLRVYDVSHIIFNGKNAHCFFDIQINEQANNWYIDTAGPGRSWCVDLGLLLPDGRFITILRSNTVTTPLEGPSWITDEEWMIPEDMFARLYGMGFGLGRSSPVGKGWQEKVRRQLGGVSSLASPIKKSPSK